MFEEGSKWTVFLNVLSRLLGWTYFICWSFASYPQPIKNYCRKSVTGLAIDQYPLNILGHSCYTIFCLSFLFSETVKQEYRRRFPGTGNPTVRLNDFAFAAHALFWSLFTFTQFYFWGYSRSPTQRISRSISSFVLGWLIVIAGLCFLVLTRPNEWEWLDVLYFLTTTKLIITLIKYFPQARLNYLNKSTRGFSVYPAVLDLIGAVLSIAQLFTDAYLARSGEGQGESNWGAVIANPLKFWLGFISIGFDLIFIVQHYVLYKEKDRKEIFHQQLEPEVEEQYSQQGESEDENKMGGLIVLHGEESRAKGKNRAEKLLGGAFKGVNYGGTSVDVY